MRQEIFGATQVSGLARLTNPLNRYQFNNSNLLKLCDAVRSQLQENHTLGPRAEEVLQLLSAMTNDESDGRYSVNMGTISACRLDKLLSDILLPDNGCSPEEVALAYNLQRNWRLRFRQEYFDLDKKRLEKFATKYGQLRDIAFTDTLVFAHGRWQAMRCESLSEVEGDQQFEPGQDSTLSDAPVTLISQVGARTRLLRGHCLKSQFAPKSGVRYDGLYIIRQYGHKLQEETGIHRVVITLERVLGQKPMEELVQVPRPSQMDEWLIFEKYEGEMVKKRQGNEAFTEWKVEKAQEKADHSEWERVTRMTAELAQRKQAKVKFAKEPVKIPQDLQSDDLDSS
ncbi:hypothetical protein BB8028_0003g07370 [Beauveria bassiana]|uniref:YDG domain-containing protein n=1 Tax=Beauveria bassiana TaxID=176275 RepID=A0A2S7Y7W9_BEABA|nr:hypothetical protein BB8028_0003g07370 [Beauveria bassiana]